MEITLILLNSVRSKSYCIFMKINLALILKIIPEILNFCYINYKYKFNL